MAKLFYSMAGEGRGHAARVWTLVEKLRHRHDITLFAPHDAFEMLRPRYEGSESVHVRPIPGLRFYYDASHRIDIYRTIRGFFDYLHDARPLVHQLAEEIRREKPDLVITDFEPALPRAAERCGVPFISLDHQHFLTVSDLSSLPGYLRMHAAYMGMVVRAFYTRQVSTMVSSFFFPELKSRHAHVKQIGVLLRDEIADAKPEPGDYLLVYVRKFLDMRLVEAVRATGRPARIYGGPMRAPEGQLTFCLPNHGAFQKDLIGSAALITTAGNQLVGEALYLKKPVLALPELGNYEQYINAHFLRQSGAGDWAELSTIDAQVLRRFVDRLDEFRARVPSDRLNGNAIALAEIARFLPQTSSTNGN